MKNKFLSFLTVLAINSYAISPIDINYFDLDSGGQHPTETEDYFGETLSHGDYNGDGYEDVAVSYPGGNQSSGAVMVFYGTNAGIVFESQTHFQSYSYLQQQANTNDFGSEAGDNFGESLTSGDLNGDGYDDLVVGTPIEDIESSQATRAGAINIFYGAANGLENGSDFIYESTQLNLGGPQSDARFGDALVAGDFNGDGYDDLVVGVPYAHITTNGTTYFNAGKVYIFYGSVNHISTANAFVLHQNVSGTTDSSERDDHFGSVLAVGDFDRQSLAKSTKGGGNYDDLAIGIPSEDVDGVDDAGAVQVFYGSVMGLTNNDQFWSEQNKSQNNHFGFSLATGDFNRQHPQAADLSDDLLIGVPNEGIGNATEAGIVQVIYGSSIGLTAQGSHIISQNSAGIFGVPENADSFGYALAAFYPDNQLQASAVITAAGETYHANYDGVAYIIPGSSAGLDTTASTFIANPDAGNDDNFGSSVIAFSTYSQKIHALKAASIIFGVPGNTSSDNNVRAGAIYEMQYHKFEVTAGLNGSWYNPQTSGQGLFFDVLPTTDLFFAAWFTYDTSHPDASIPSVIGSNDARWVTASGPIYGKLGHNTQLTIYDSSNGKFNDATTIYTNPVGYALLSFSGCNAGYVDYFYNNGITGGFPIQRTVRDNQAACEYITSNFTIPTKEQKPDNKRSFKVNIGINGAWYNPQTSGQGFLFDIFPVNNLMFLSWFTYDTNFASANLTSQIGNPENRWLTASGPLVEDGTSNLAVFDSTGGLFNIPTVVTTTQIGALEVTFSDCQTGEVKYTLDSGLSGTIPITRIADDNVALCESLNATGKNRQISSFSQ